MIYPEIPLGELITTKGGGTPSKQVKEYWDGDIPWASVKDLTGIYLSKTQDYITKEGLKNSNSNLIPEDNVILATRMAVGRACINTFPVAINQDLRALFCSEKILPKYLLWFLLSSSHILERQSSGATVKGITLDAIYNLKISLPIIEEQKRIAAILDKADRVRRKRQEAIRLTEELGRSIFLDMFGDPISQGWKMVKVGDMAAKTKNSMRTGPFGSNLLHSEFVDEGIPVLGIDNAVKNRFLWAKPRFITPEKYQELKNYTVYPEDVIITIMGTCGRCAIIPNDCPTAINTKHLCCITTNKDVCLPEFLHGYFLSHPMAKQYFKRNTKGAIMDGLNQTIIKGLPIPLAPIDLQKRYKEAIQKLNALQLRAKNHFSSSENLFNSLLQRAFRGEL